MSYVRVHSRRCSALWAGLVLGAVVCLAGAAPAVAELREWSPEVLDALAAYYAGSYVEAQQLCLRVVSSATREAARRDAAIVQALCLLRMPGRADRLDGRARLAQLTREDSTLLEEPECSLAYGIAQSALGESADSLDALARAAEGFAARENPQRELAALAALAEAWVRHTEWEVTPARFGVRRPAGSREAQAIRREKIAAARARMVELPGHTDAVERLDLMWARFLLEAGRDPDEGRRVLAQLAAAEVLTGPAAEAALLLAGQHVQSEQWPDALRLYERVQREGPQELARQAAEQVHEITRPRIVLDVPAAVPSGQSPTLRLRVRGIAALQVEVRRADIESWLASSERRGSEALLPEAGSVQMARDLDTHMSAAYAWWKSDTLELPLEFTAPPGAYVALAKGQAADGREYKDKRLVVVSDLSAVCFVGPEHVNIWATGGGGAELEAKFWMRRSFRPVRVQFAAGAARFRLPNEARVMRDKEWVCLVRAGEHLAVCRGRLPAATHLESTAPAVALLAGPPAVQVGESLYVSGLLLPRGARSWDPAAAGPLELQVLDAVDRVQLIEGVEVTGSGAFSVAFPITPGQAGKHLRVVAWYGGRTLENIAGRPVVQVPPTEAARFRVWCEVPAWVKPALGVLSGSVRAEYPWGTRPKGARVRCVVRAVQLPTTQSNEAPRHVGFLVREGRLNEDGGFKFALSTGEFGVSGVPLAISVEASVTGWEGRDGVGYGEVLVAPQPAHVWLTQEPADPQVGQDVRFRLAWFVPGACTVAQRPDLEVRRGEQTLTRLRMQPGSDGLHSELWRPTEPGSYEVAATIPVMDEPPLLLRRTVVVRPAQTTPQAAATRLRCAAHFARQDGRPGVRVCLEGESASPLAVLAEAGDPLAVGGIDRLTGHEELFLPLESEPLAGTRVVVVGSGDGGELLATQEVAPNPQRAVRLQLSPPTADVWPGTTVSVNVACRGTETVPPGLTLTARLIDAAAYGHADPRPGGRSEGLSPMGQRLTIVSSSGWQAAPDQAAVHDGAAGTVSDSTATLQAALSEGATLWSTSRAVTSETTELAVPVPARPGLYQLIAVARTIDGALATDAMILDARRGVRVALDTPARLTLGDRTLVAVLLENGYPEIVGAQVRLEVAGGLQVESVWAVGAQRRRLPRAADEPLTVELPAGGRVWLHVDVEAAGVGTGAVAVEVTARGARRSAERAYEVLPVQQPVRSGSGLTLKRSLRVWRASPESLAAEEEHGTHKYWQSASWSPGQRLAPGEFVLVREELVLSEAAPALVWSQRLPATCRTGRAAPRRLQEVGQRVVDSGDRLGFRVPELKPGVHVHEYFLAAVRPGVCTLPVPELRAGATRISVAVEPGELRLIVVAGE